MAEEVANASVAIPRAIMLSVLINGSLGFGMLIGILYCAGDIDAALNSPTGYPYIEIFYQGTGSMSGTLTMCSILLIIWYRLMYRYAGCHLSSILVLCKRPWCPGMAALDQGKSLPHP